MASSELRANNSGGLNTVSSPLNLQPDESPLLLNADVLDGGQVRKRYGTRIIRREDNVSKTANGTSFVSSLGIPFVVTKEGTSIRLYYLNNDSTNLLMTKANVWDARAANTRAVTLATSEPESRVLFFTGRNKPVQLTFVEQQQFVTTGATTTLVLNNADRFANAAAGTLIVFRDRQLITTSFGASYNAGTRQLTLTGLPSYSGTDVEFIVFHVSWQWWAEALYWFGSDFFQSVTRFNSQPTDVNVAIPADLRSDLDTQPSSGFFTYPLIAYQSQNFQNTYTVRTDRTPTLATEYSHSSGGLYTVGVGNKVQSGFLFWTFGALQGGGTPTPLYAIRRRELRFNNRTGVQGQHLDVWVSGTLQAQNTSGVTGSATYADYWLLGQDFNTLLGNNTTNATHISFEGSTSIGVDFNARIELVNKERTHIGSAALATRGRYTDAAYVPMFGLGLYADYLRGRYPRTGVLYQNRLVLGGFEHRPLQLVFSSPGNARVPTESSWSFFQTLVSNLSPTDPFDVLITSDSGDRVVMLVTFQEALFALTRENVYRLQAQGDNILSGQTAILSHISSTGAINPWAYVRTEFSVLYLSQTGVYDLVPQVQNSEYKVQERSATIKNRFTLLEDPAFFERPWMAYDPNRRFVYVGMPEPASADSTYYMFVYNVVMDAWSEYRTYGGFQAFDGFGYRDASFGENTMLLVTGRRNTNLTPANFGMLKLNQADVFIDFQQVLAEPDPRLTPFFYQPYVRQEANTNQKEYALSFRETDQIRGFELLPYNNVDDVIVLRNSTPLVFSPGGVTTAPGQFCKTPNGHILLHDFPEYGDILHMFPRIPPIVYQ